MRGTVGQVERIEVVQRVIDGGIREAPVLDVSGINILHSPPYNLQLKVKLNNTGDRDAPIHRGAPTGPSSSRSGARSYEDARQATGPRGSAAGGGRGGFDRGRGGYSNYRGGGGGGYDGGQGGRGGYAGGGGLDYNIRSNRDAPMDRRAIEEGRRQREAERAARREAELDEEARVVEERTIAREKDEKSAAYSESYATFGRVRR